MFSKACEHGIRALTIIASKSEGGKRIGIKEICEIANTPESFTAKVLQNLVKRGILDSQKGPSGGFYFSRDYKVLSIYEIVEAIDGNGIFTRCGLGLPKCDALNPCPLHTKFEVVRDELRAMCDNNTLESLVNELKEGVYKS